VVKIKAMEIQPITKKRDKTLDIKPTRSGGGKRWIATGRKAKITSAMPPSQTMPAPK
jgi:hypothetical protein